MNGPYALKGRTEPVGLQAVASRTREVLRGDGSERLFRAVPVRAVRLVGEKACGFQLRRNDRAESGNRRRRSLVAVEAVW